MENSEEQLCRKCDRCQLKRLLLAIITILSQIYGDTKKRKRRIITLGGKNDTCIFGGKMQHALH